MMYRGFESRHAIFTTIASAILIAAAASGCGSTQPSRFYNLSSIATADNCAALHGAVLVGPVSIPAAVDRPEIVVQVAPNRVDLDEFNRWVEPLSDGIARAVAGDLGVLLGTDVAVAPLVNFNADYRVTIDVQRFDSVPGQSTLLEAVWTVRGTSARQVQTGRTVARETLQGEGYDALAAAHSRAVAKLSQDIAAALRATAAATR